MNPLRKLKNIKEATLKKVHHIAILLIVLITSTTCIADNTILESIRAVDLAGFEAISNAAFNQLSIAELQQYLRLARAKSSSFHSHATALEQSYMQWVFSPLTNLFLGSVQEEQTHAEEQRTALDQIADALHIKVQEALIKKRKRDKGLRLEVVNNALQAERDLRGNRGSIARLTAKRDRLQAAQQAAQEVAQQAKSGQYEIVRNFLDAKRNYETAHRTIATLNDGLRLEKKTDRIRRVMIPHLLAAQNEKTRLHHRVNELEEQAEKNEQLQEELERERVDAERSCNDLGEQAYTQLEQQHETPAASSCGTVDMALFQENVQLRKQLDLLKTNFGFLDLDDSDSDSESEFN